MRRRALRPRRILDCQGNVVHARLLKDMHHTVGVVIALCAIIKRPTDGFHDACRAGAVEGNTEWLAIHLAADAAREEAGIQPRGKNDDRACRLIRFTGGRIDDYLHRIFPRLLERVLLDRDPLLADDSREFIPEDPLESGDGLSWNHGLRSIETDLERSHAALFIHLE